MSNSSEFAPYFLNGRLYLTLTTIDMLVSFGLHPGLAQAALQGLDLVDHREAIAAINATFEALLEDMVQNRSGLHH